MASGNAGNAPKMIAHMSMGKTAASMIFPAFLMAIVLRDFRHIRHEVECAGARCAIDGFGGCFGASDMEAGCARCAEQPLVFDAGQFLVNHHLVWLLFSNGHRNS